MERIYDQLARELSIDINQVRTSAELLRDATVPFIARYRKEATGGLDDQQLRHLDSRLLYLKKLDDRREVVLNSIREQGKLNPSLEKVIREADTVVRLEDLYLPYRPKRRTKAQQARENGLEPLSEKLLRNPQLEPERTALDFLDEKTGIDSIESALEGARQILIEKFSEEAVLIGRLREYLWKRGIWRSKVIKKKEEEGTKFSDYFDYWEPINRVPSHRALALLRGEKEGFLRLKITEPEDESVPLHTSRPSRAIQMIRDYTGVRDRGRPADSWLLETVQQTWKTRVHPKLENGLETRARELAETEAIKVFGDNLRDLLLAAPAGARTTMGLDPGYRTGVKVAVVDGTGKFLSKSTVFPHQPQREWKRAIRELAGIAERFQVELISIGNGTASRETDQLVQELITEEKGLNLNKAVVSEAGASVYSASELAAKEFPDLDVSIRGAVSIARRLQDPLAELVKIEPKSIGVGQYQHDVNQTKLGEALDHVVEDCVNAVGTEVNTASIQLLALVSGLGPVLAARIVAYRDSNGPFQNRRELKNVTGFGAKTFELSAGFLRIRDGRNPLDASAVHPEAYSIVQKIARKTGKSVSELIGAASLLRSLNPVDFIDQQFGEPTVRDIFKELEKPGRDPRPEFKTARFREGVEKLEELEKGMQLEGVVTNVTNFGAFIDVGVHQDGLVHISELANRFVKDPRDVVRAGQVVQVKVLDVDVRRKRISLSMRK